MTGATKTYRDLASICVRWLVIGLMAGSAILLNTAAAKPLIETKQGFVRGFEEASVRRFLGIPYAAPPVGDLRWKPPQPHSSWSGVLDAEKFGSHCAQIAHVVGESSNSEDCLFLNVYVPNESDDEQDEPGDAQVQRNTDLPARAVMVWIHGGAFTAGESYDFDASRLAKMGGVIVVTINYRLGVFGFLAHWALRSSNNASGNYGILDQQFALEWVQQNISAFGGDPDNVTIFGQSAGGLSVLVSLASPGAAGLFHKAIVQSGAYELVLPSLDAGESQGTAFARNIGCSDQTASCLRALTVQQILDNPIFPSPVVDGFVLPVSLQIAAAYGLFNRVPVINGSNHDEARFMVAMNELAGQVVTAAQYPAALAAAFGPEAGSRVREQYPLSSYTNADEALAAIQTDSSFACPARLADQALWRFVPVFAYEFNDEDAPEIFLAPVSYPYGAAHGSELQYFFPAEDLTHLPGRPEKLGARQRKLSEMMMRYWTQFAKKGDPNGSLTPHWAKYELSLDKFQSLAPGSIAPKSDFAASHRCAFWAMFPQ